MLPAIFITGPHGCGKTTMINKLLQQDDIFIENDFDINFLTEFPNIEFLNDFERSLLRLYHRYYIMNYCLNKGKNTEGKSIIVSRSIYDSECYIETYHKLGWMNESNYRFVKKIFDQISDTPPTVVLNPSVQKNMERLTLRHERKEREERNKIFSKEDTEEFIVCMHEVVEKYRNYKNVLYIEDNDQDSINCVIRWVKEKNYEYKF